MDENSLTRVVYLIGAGASHACVKRANSSLGILMEDLGQPLSDKLREIVQEQYQNDVSIGELVNSVVNKATDFEHIMTFLEESPSRPHRKLANDMREAFEEVLREKLDSIHTEIGTSPVELYEVLLDMYDVEGFPEVLRGILTTNYDGYIEEAIRRRCTGPVNFGFNMTRAGAASDDAPLLKLHGSFGWGDTWPISFDGEDATLWIPPGIQKAKQGYPFSVIWGLARDLLSCDILRVIGCRLSSNDWDLISLLFTTRHVGELYRPYRIEIIDDPLRAEEIKESFPYLGVRSILEIEGVGSAVVDALSGGAKGRFEELTDEEKRGFFGGQKRGHNWFALWLKLKVETHSISLGAMSTKRGLVESFLGE